jgi:hypothetical protein
MAYDRIYHEYLDIYEHHHFIEIYKVGYTNSYNVYYSGSDPVNIRHGAVSKSEWDQEIIQGKELTFSFVLPRADVDVFNDLMESQYKDFRVRYYVNSSLKFQGYLKPENLYKRYEKNPPNIEVQLSATDALADLKSIRFGDFNHFGRIITGRYSILQIVKYALEHLEIQADFKVQLNTYESTLNQPTWCPLLHTFVDAKRFFEEDNPYETVMYCWEVIEAVLKNFNVKFFQKNGEYYIVNYYEGDSFEYNIPWTTLLQTSRTAISRVRDITQYKFREYIEQQKIHPYASTIMVFKAKNVGGDVSGVDPANWYLGWDIHFQTFNYTTNDNTLYLTVINSESYPTYPNYIQHKNGVQVNRTTSNDYIGVKFNYRLFSITHTGDLPIMQLKIEVLRPSGQWAAPYATILAWGSEVTYESPFAESFRIVESGTYFIRISFVMEYPEAYDWTGLSFYIKDKIQLLYAPNRAVQEYIPNQGSDDLEIEYVQRNTKGYEDLREEFYFGDIVAETDEASSLVGSMLGALYVGGTVHASYPSKKWKAFSGVSAMRILDLYARTILLNRSKYKNYLRCTIIDRHHTIEENYILIIEDIPYVIAGFNKNYRTGEFEVDLVELIADVEIVDGYDDAEELTIKSATIYEGTPEPPLGIYQENHGFEVGNAIGSYIDEFEDVIYFKAIANPEYPELSRVIGVVTEILTDDFFRYKSDGYIQVPENVVAVSDGLYYYLSTTVAGKYTTTPPTDEGTPKVLIGYGTERGLKIEITPQGNVLMTDMSVTGTGTEIDPITLVNDENSPTANKYYGTNELAVLGYHLLPEGGGQVEIPTITQNGHGFVVGDVIRHNGTIYVKAQANNDVNAQACGIVSEYIDTNQFKFIADGVIEGVGVPGEEYFLSTTTPGQLITLPTPEVWNLGEVRLSCGWGTSLGLKVEIDVGDVIGSFEFPTAELKGYWDREFEFCVNKGIAETFDVDLWAVYEYDIIEAILESDGELSGVAIKINGVNVGGLDNLTVNTIAMTVASSDYSVTEGNRVTLSTTVSYSGDPSVIKGKLKILRS